MKNLKTLYVALLLFASVFVYQYTEATVTTATISGLVTKDRVSLAVSTVASTAAADSAIIYPRFQISEFRDTTFTMQAISSVAADNVSWSFRLQVSNVTSPGTTYASTDWETIETSTQLDDASKLHTFHPYKYGKNFIWARVIAKEDSTDDSSAETLTSYFALPNNPNFVGDYSGSTASQPSAAVEDNTWPVVAVILSFASLAISLFRKK